MKKTFLFKGVSVLGAILLLASAVLPGINAYAYSDDTWTWDYVYDEDSWNSSKASGALKVYYENNPSEDLWCGDSTNGHKASFNDKVYVAQICNDSNCSQPIDTSLTTTWGETYQTVNDGQNSYLLTMSAEVGSDEIYELYQQEVLCTKPSSAPDNAYFPVTSDGHSWAEPAYGCAYAVPFESLCTKPSSAPDNAYFPVTSDGHSWAEPAYGCAYAVPFEATNNVCVLPSNAPSEAIFQDWMVTDEGVCYYKMEAVPATCTLPSDAPSEAIFQDWMVTDGGVCYYKMEAVSPQIVPSGKYVKLNSSSYSNCAPSYQGRIANGAVSPWISVVFKQAFKGTIKFNYTDYQDGADVYPRGQAIKNRGPEGKVWGEASMPGEFPGITNFDIDKFSATLVGALTVSTNSIKAAKYIESKDENQGRERRNLDGSKFSISNSYDTDSKTLTVTITDNGLEAYVGGNSETAKKWIGLIADFGTTVNGSAASEGIEGYGIEQSDRRDAHIYDGDESSNTDFIIWITREDKNGKTIRFVNAVDADDYVNVKFVFQDKQQTSGSSGGGGGGGSSSSYSCKNLPSNATANNSTKPRSNTNYSYDTDTSKVCTFQCNKGYTWNEKDSKCEEKAEATTGDTSDAPKTDDNQSPLDDGLTQELHDAYDFAHENGVTTMPTAAEANMYGPLTRIAMAKMLSQYATNVLGQKPANIVVPEFPDVTAELNEEYSNAVTLAYQLGIMGINIQEFRPYDNATRAEFGTALSRMLFSTPDGEEYEGTAQYYVNHLKKLVEEKIITNANPNLQELRGYVMIMLMRAAE